eukprot:6187160-Pleurochrysis_carterae.AAC.1
MEAAVDETDEQAISSDVSYLTKRTYTCVDEPQHVRSSRVVSPATSLSSNENCHRTARIMHGVLHAACVCADACVHAAVTNVKAHPCVHP